MIPFNKPYLTGNESKFIETAFEKGRFSGNGYFTGLCHEFFQEHFGFKHPFLTNSATNALEMAAILCDIKQDDEVILPSYTFVSTATPFAQRGASLVFCDNNSTNPNISAKAIEKLITEKTKAIVVVHYAGMACDMQPILELAEKNNLFLIEDAAHSITSKYNDQFLGTFGHMAVLSFHETKNISSGQGGLLIVNDEDLAKRAEIVWAKGTNRIDMERGKVTKYEWIDDGSSFYPSEISAALLYAQLKQMEVIQEKRKKIWECYEEMLIPLAAQNKISLPKLESYQTNNYHIFYFLCDSNEERDELLQFMKDRGALALFHYLPLHLSPYMKNKGTSFSCPNAESIASRVVRLPLFADLSSEDSEKVANLVLDFYGS